MKDLVYSISIPTNNFKEIEEMDFMRRLEIIENIDGVASGDTIDKMIQLEKQKGDGGQSSISFQYLAKNKNLTYYQYKKVAEIELARCTSYNMGVIENLLNNPSVCETIKSRCRNV